LIRFENLTNLLARVDVLIRHAVAGCRPAV